ncbi:MAG: NAD(P)H-quinone oxidoreductase subunit I, chloroplastic [Verrucomicrobiae bacterium]|nr:NAD(P)H-quinone oxidoreductase subunit I, chloroplastic [Verrucomicrobiae bacterium]
MGFLGKGLFQGMAVTARNFVGTYFDRGTREKLVTYQYPEEKPPLPENSRSFPFLVYDGTPDAMRCVACKICETECPPQCIYIVMDRDEKGKPQQRPKVFDIDISVCMQCQICVEVCPFEAIKMDNDYEKSQYGRFDDLIEHLPDLLKSNEYYNEIKPTEAKAVDAKLKAEAEKKAKKGTSKPAAAAPAKPAAPAPAPKPATAPAGKITIPEDAPFTAEQRAWLAGFLSAGGVATSGTGVSPVAVAETTGETPVPLPEATPAAEAPAGGWPWHDPGLGMSQRMDLVKAAPLADKLMAAMAQTDCHACGYDCRGYADAIAAGSETDLSLCLPGEAETAKKLEELMKEAGKL